VAPLKPSGIRERSNEPPLFHGLNGRGPIEAAANRDLERDVAAFSTALMAVAPLKLSYVPLSQPGLLAFPRP
jgi:hypothetical protein